MQLVDESIGIGYREYWLLHLAVNISRSRCCISRVFLAASLAAAAQNSAAAEHH